MATARASSAGKLDCPLTTVSGGPVRADPGPDPADRCQQQYDDHQAAEEPAGPGGERRFGLGRPRGLTGLERFADRAGGSVRTVRGALAGRWQTCRAGLRIGAGCCRWLRARCWVPARGRTGRRGGAITPPAGGGVCGAEYCAATPCAWRGVGDTGPSGWDHHSGAVFCGRPLPGFFVRRWSDQCSPFGGRFSNVRHQLIATRPSDSSYADSSREDTASNCPPGDLRPGSGCSIAPRSHTVTPLAGSVTPRARVTPSVPSP